MQTIQKWLPQMMLSILSRQFDTISLITKVHKEPKIKHWTCMDRKFYWSESYSQVIAYNFIHANRLHLYCPLKQITYL